jgi:hypothetical protein
VLVTAIAVLFIIVTLGLVALQTVDFETQAVRQETAGSLTASA